MSDWRDEHKSGGEHEDTNENSADNRSGFVWFYIGPPEETIFTADPVFTLYAYFWDDGAAPSGLYYISAALTSSGGPVTPPGLALGSFDVGVGLAPPVTYSVTSGMTYGTPPIETAPLGQAHDLPGHGIYDTYFVEIPFTFNPLNRADPYNTAVTTGIGPTPNPLGEMYYQAFAVSVADFISGPPEHYYRIHFDLYNLQPCVNYPGPDTCTPSSPDYRVAKFAPFSHDAEDPPPPGVPEPASVLLTGMGMLGLAAFLKKRRAGR